jgi:hypothetical protein
VKFRNEGLTLWYGTPDAPAPLDEVVSRTEASVVVGVHPANPTNAVSVRYRVDGAVVQSLPAEELRTDYSRETQYFGVTFPRFVAGDVVEYCPLLSCAGRQVPAASTAERFPSKFFLEKVPSTRKTADAPPLASAYQRHVPELTFLAALTIRVDTQFIGETPEGVRIDFYATDGTVIGPDFRGKVMPGSNDHMIVRTDGVGIIRVRAALASDDGAMFEVDEIGSIDFGPDGYRRACANDLPSSSPLIVAPRLLTGHPKYRWLNRSQCLGVGRTRLDERTVEYDLFSVAPRPLSSKS